MDVRYQHSTSLPSMNSVNQIKSEEAGYAQTHSTITYPSALNSEKYNTTSQHTYGPPPPYAPRSGLSVSNLVTAEPNSDRGGDKWSIAQEGVRLPSIHEALGNSNATPLYETNDMTTSPNSAKKIRRHSGHADQAEHAYSRRLKYANHEASEPRGYDSPKQSHQHYSLQTVQPQTVPAPYQPHIDEFNASFQERSVYARGEGHGSHVTPSPITPVGNYTHYPQSYVTYPSGQPTGPVPHYASNTHPQQPTNTSSGWNSANEDARMAQPANIVRPASSVYGDSVKKHLENFDLESSLNMISEGSKAILEFSSHYSQRAHNSQSSGPLPGSTPHLNDIDEMMRQNAGVYESLSRLKEVVLTQQKALAQRSKERQEKSLLNQAAEFSANTNNVGKGGFAGQEGKKRRPAGQKAAPGRCHSCNRAETPEWRRGPDGARTLCNACGLHYAKIVRKSGASKLAHGGSNLKPKPNAPGPDAV